MLKQAPRGGKTDLDFFLLNQRKSGKAAGHDSVVAELLKTDLEESTKELTRGRSTEKQEQRNDSKATYGSVQIGGVSHFYQS